MTILTLHNCYQRPGGEDQVYRAESALLEERGHRVIRFTEDNARIPSLGCVRAALTSLWNPVAAREVRRIIRRERVTVAHFHNTFPLLSASVLRAARQAGAAVVQTLHNYRLLCPNGLLFRAGGPCRLCVGRRFPWPGLRHGCYRSSRAATALAAASVLTRRLTGTWHDGVDAYIVLSEFARSLLLQSGAPADKVIVKPNFVYPDPGMGDGAGGYVLFLGRLSEEKGLRVLVKAWKMLKPATKLRIIGDGPLAGWLARQADGDGIEWRGPLPRDQALAELRGAALLAAPSLCYEGSPLAVLEAFATGAPVAASALGGLAELVRPGLTGWLIPPGDAEAWAATLDQALSQPKLLRQMRRQARLDYEAHYSAEANYQMLLAVYRQALSRV